MRLTPILSEVGDSLTIPATSKNYLITKTFYTPDLLNYVERKASRTSESAASPRTFTQAVFTPPKALEAGRWVGLEDGSLVFLES